MKLKMSKIDLIRKDGTVIKFNKNCFPCDFCKHGVLHYEKYGVEQCTPKISCDIIRQKKEVLNNEK